MKESYKICKVNVCRFENGCTMILPYDHVIDYGNGIFYIGINNGTVDDDDGRSVPKILWGVMKNFKVLVQPQYTALGPYSEGMIPYKDAGTGLWGYISVKENFTIPAKFRIAGVFMSGVAKVQTRDFDGLWIDKNGCVALKPIEEEKKANEVQLDDSVDSARC